MIKVKDLSLGFQNVYFNYKKSFIKKRDNIGNQYEEMNKYLLDKQKEIINKLSVEDLLFTNKINSNSLGINSNNQYDVNEELINKLNKKANVSRTKKIITNLILLDNIKYPKHAIVNRKKTNLIYDKEFTNCISTNNTNNSENRNTSVSKKIKIRNYLNESNKSKLLNIKENNVSRNNSLTKENIKHLKTNYKIANDSNTLYTNKNNKILISSFYNVDMNNNKIKSNNDNSTKFPSIKYFYDIKSTTNKNKINCINSTLDSSYTINKKTIDSVESNENNKKVKVIKVSNIINNNNKYCIEKDKNLNLITQNNNNLNKINCSNYKNNNTKNKTNKNISNNNKFYNKRNTITNNSLDITNKNCYNKLKLLTVKSIEEKSNIIKSKNKKLKSQIKITNELNKDLNLKFNFFKKTFVN